MKIKLEPPHPHQKILLHACCAPCCCSILSAMRESGLNVTVYFYNPNVHPAEEYEIRKKEVIRYAYKWGVPFVDADYDSNRWFDLTRGLENEPERGRRCDLCFGMRLSRAAEYAHQHGFKILTSSLGISRWKDFDQVTAAGIRAVQAFPELTYWTHPWRKKGGSQRMVEISKEENFYRQFYCGCLPSLQSANERRLGCGDLNPVPGPSKGAAPRRSAAKGTR